MKTIAQIAAELQGYDPQALSAADVNTFLERLVEPVSATEDLPLFSALGRGERRSGEARHAVVAATPPRRR